MKSLTLDKTIGIDKFDLSKGQLQQCRMIANKRDFDAAEEQAAKFRAENGMVQPGRNYTHYIKQGWEKRIKEYRNSIYRRSVKFGENLMPADIVEIMNKSERAGKFHYITHNGMTNEWCGRLLLLKDVYESCGFVFPEDYLTRETYFEYFY